MPYMSLRLPTLHQYLHSALESLVYPETQTPLVHVHTRPRAMQLNRMLKRKLSTLQSASRVTLSTDAVPSAPSGEGQGYVVSCSFYTSQGVYIPLAQISCLASASGISLRTGCVCNPGGAAALRGEIFQERMKDLSMVDHTMDLNEVYMFMGGAEMAGVVRISLGLVSNFEDIWRFVCWARGLLDETKREKDLERLGCLHEDECSKEMDS
jgi:selenocysteine lyase/cysteine desulfurase